MKAPVWIGTVAVVLAAGGWGLRAECPCCQPAQENVLTRVAPAGGWHPYGGGLLRWWPRHCFPCGGGPDDYCRKPLPNMCRPCYPPWYTFGTPATCCPLRTGPKP